jgi:CBS domain-containing protein
MAKKFSLKKEVFSILKSKRAPKSKPQKKEIKRDQEKPVLKEKRKQTAIRQIKKELEKKDLGKLVKEKKKIIIGTAKIKDIMISDLKTLDEKDTLGTAADLFFREDIGGAPVISGKKLVGVINKSDILGVLGKNDIDVKDIKNLGRSTVREVMRKPFTVREDDTLSQSIKLMNRNNAERLFVLNKNGSLTGIVTRTDVMKGIMKLFFDVMQKEMGTMIETDIDRILHMVTTRVSIGKIARETGMKEDHIEELARILEEHGLIKIEYPAIGKPILRRTE